MENIFEEFYLALFELVLGICIVFLFQNLWFGLVMGV